MGAGCTIQLTYDPNGDGVLDPFNLIQLTVFQGKLNIGLKYATGEIAVYNDMTAGTWTLNETNLVRVTLEYPADWPPDQNFTVDNIVFEPAQ